MRILVVGMVAIPAQTVVRLMRTAIGATFAKRSSLTMLILQPDQWSSVYGHDPVACPVSLVPAVEEGSDPPNGESG